MQVFKCRKNAGLVIRISHSYKNKQNKDTAANCTITVKFFFSLVMIKIEAKYY
jgi:hypothetical protein